MRIVDLLVHSRDVPLVIPFVSAKRGVVRHAATNLVELRLEDGRSAWGEMAMPSVSGESAAGVRAALEGPLREAVVGEQVPDLERLVERVSQALTGNPGAKSAVDIAVHDAFAQWAGLPLYRFLGGGGTELESCVTVGGGLPEEAAKRAAELVAAGFIAIKVKVGGTVSADVRRVLAVREAVGHDVRLRLDANQGWTAKEAVHAMGRLQGAGAEIELLEQPVPAWDLAGMCYVRERVETLVAADESVVTARDAMEVARQGAADVLAVKLQKNGGIRDALRVIAVGEAAGLPCMIGCSLETEVAISAAAAIAAARSSVAYVDLDSPLWLAGSPVRGGARYRSTLLHLPEAPGLGVDGLGPADEVLGPDSPDGDEQPDR